jgi:hypothetical protein
MSNGGVWLSGAVLKNQLPEVSLPAYVGGAWFILFYLKIYSKVS